jgi:myo-inositol-1(or 4)-monophosphatase
LDSEFDSFISSTIEANRELYKILLKDKRPEFYESGDIGAGGDVSIGMDIIAEDIFIKHLKEYGEIDSEECGLYGEGDCKIIIDPLDGSDNYKSNFPYFGTSVALEKDGDVKVGIISNLANGTLFVKTKTSSVFTKLDSIKFYEVVPNPYASVGIFERAYVSKIYAKKLNHNGYKYRSSGAVALSLAYTSQVQFFIYEGEMRDYDVKAGLFMCEGLYQHKEKDLTLICTQLNHFENLKKILL